MGFEIFARKRLLSFGDSNLILTLELSDKMNLHSTSLDFRDIILAPSINPGSS